ncbi:MAG: molybdenum cofactor biosynthesis protein MoaE [Actinomycetes bacterium]
MTTPLAPGPGRVRRARVTADPLSVDAVLGAVLGSAVGGVGLFVGVVRDLDDDRRVTSLDYSAHPHAAAVLAAVAGRVAAAHDVLAVAVEHRTGHLEVGDLAVVVAAGAVHRAPALEACRQLIDDLKEQVPIWKEQHFLSGETEWVGLP